MTNDRLRSIIRLVQAIDRDNGLFVAFSEYEHAMPWDRWQEFPLLAAMLRFLRLNRPPYYGLVRDAPSGTSLP